MVTNDGPYEFYAAAAANYATRFGDMVWYFGESYLSQNTAQQRVVCVPDSRVGVANGSYIGAQNFGGPESFDIKNLIFMLEFHIFGKIGPEGTLFKSPNTQSNPGLVAKVATALEETMKGPDNAAIVDATIQQKDANNPTVSLWDLTLFVSVSIPLKYSPPDVQGFVEPEEGFVITGELTNE